MVDRVLLVVTHSGMKRREITYGDVSYEDETYGNVTYGDVMSLYRKIVLNLFGFLCRILAMKLCAFTEFMECNRMYP
jgi:hypothetical protein